MTIFFRSVRLAYASAGVVGMTLLAWAVGCLNADQHQANPAKAAQGTHSQGEKTMTIQITSLAFSQGHAIPKKYTGEGADVSPPLAWTGVPEGAKELVLICDDPDAPTDEPWVHWVLYQMPPHLSSLPEGVARKPHPKDPQGVSQGKNSWPEGENIGYRGPMPPKGHGVHHYYFKLYAIAIALEAEPGLDKRAILERIEGHILAEGALIGTYQR